MRFGVLFGYGRALFAASLVMMGAVVAIAGRADDKAVPELSESAQAVADLGMAQDLIAYGRRTKSPEALLMAALILHRTPSEKVGDAADTETPAALIEEARKARADDKTLAGLADQAAEAVSETARGAVTGPRNMGGVLAPGAKADITVVCQPRTNTIFRVNGIPVAAPNRRPVPPILQVEIKDKGRPVGGGLGTSVGSGYGSEEGGPVTVTILNPTPNPVRFNLYHN
ncbi:MAG: hypothetical protein FJ297_11335 [Planctomycetes bacterium]|nr:hypothetical protein [Planctomycetota bacterium]